MEIETDFLHEPDLENEVLETDGDDEVYQDKTNPPIVMVDNGKYLVHEGGVINVAYYKDGIRWFTLGIEGINMEANTWYTVNDEGDFIKHNAQTAE